MGRIPGIEVVEVKKGQLVHVRLHQRARGDATIEILSLESLGMVQIPRTAVAQLRAALKRVADQ